MPHPPDGTESPFPAAISVSTNIRILVVDDSRVNLKVAAGILRKLGYECDLAGSGAEALAACAGRRYDLIFMDCHMPVMDGFRATAEIRKGEVGTKRTPVIALTASLLVGDRELCFAAGMDDYLAKPVDPDQLREVLGRWLPAPANPPAPAD